MGVAEGGVGDQEAFLFEDPFREFFGAVFAEVIAGAGGRGLVVVPRRDGGFVEAGGGFEVFNLGVSVDDDVGEVGEHLRRAVLARAEVEKLGGGVDEGGGGFSGAERVVVDDVFEERDVCLHAADTEFREGAMHPVEGEIEGGGEGGDFYEE